MIDLKEINTVGSGLSRLECVLTTANGRVYVADWRGRVTIIESDGSQWTLLAGTSEMEVLPNGITLMEDGSIRLCHLGAEQGGVYRLPAGQLNLQLSITRRWPSASSLEF